ncbi:MAG: hypothetical protein WCF57_15100 [Pyrinomonadaceae bacterium]
MKTIMAVVCCLLCLCLAGASGPTPAQVEKQKSEHFSALAYMPHGGRRTTANIDLRIKSYTTDEEAKVMGAALLDGGPEVLLKALEKADSKGKITLTGRVGFYDFKLIRSRPTETGRRIYAVGDRPIGFLEAYASTRSTDYQFGILMLDLKRDEKGREKGEGVLIYAAKVKVLDGNRLEIENYGIQPIRLMGVRKL